MASFHTFHGRMEELEDYISRDKIEAAVRKLLRKAKKEELPKPICEEVVGRLPGGDLGDLPKRINEAEEMYGVERLSLLSTPLEILFQFDGPQVDFRIRQT